MGFSISSFTTIIAIALLASLSIGIAGYQTSLADVSESRNDPIEQKLDYENTDFRISGTSIDSTNNTATVTIENTGPSTINSENLTILLQDRFIADSNITYSPTIIQQGETMDITFPYNDENYVKVIDYSEKSAKTEFAWITKSYSASWQDGDGNLSFSTSGTDTRNAEITLTPVYKQQTKTLNESLTVETDSNQGFNSGSNTFSYATMSDRDHTVIADYSFTNMRQGDAGLAEVSAYSTTTSASYDGSGNDQTGTISTTFNPPDSQDQKGGTLDSTIYGEIDPSNRGGGQVRTLTIDNVRVQAQAPTRDITVTVTEDSTGNVVFDQSVNLWNEQTYTSISLNPNESYTISINNPDNGDVDLTITWEEKQA